MSSECYIIGQEMLRRMDGHDREAVVNSLQDIVPDFVRYLAELPFDDIYAKSGLDLRSWEIATIAALIVLDSATPQLKAHIAVGLNAGLTQEEITEMIMQIVVCTGFPAALNGLFAVKAVFAAH